MINTLRTSTFSIRIRCLLFTLLSLFLTSMESAAQTNDFPVFDTRLSKGLDMGVDSSEQRRDWVSKGDGYMKMAYPSGQDWGAVFITVGKPKEPPRPSRDFSPFKFLVMELKGESGGEQVEIGIKTNRQPDDGSEIKIPVRLTKHWQIFKFPLSKFELDLKNVYIVSEFVFTGGTPQTVYFKSISYVVNADGPVSSGDNQGATDARASQTPETANSSTAGSTDNGNHAGSAPANTKELFAINSQICIIVSAVLSTFLLAILARLLLRKDDRVLYEHQQDILNLVMALTAGLLAVFFVGGVILDATLKGFALSATGGFVLFLLIFFRKRLQRNGINH